ncbi:hypothetical protein UlMin_039338 [Ulmus minor]
MGEVIGEMVLEKAVGFLISEIGKAIQKTAMFKYHLKKLQETLESLNPVIKKIIESNKELDRTDEGTKNLKSLLENGKKLVQACLKVKPWNLPMKHSYAKKLIDLDNSFLRSLTLLQVQAIEIGLDIAKTVRRIDTNRERNGLGYVQSEITDYCLAPEAPPLTVGLDEPLNDLRRWALGDDNSVRVLTAPGGCGKTTLAMKLCSDDKIKGKFNKNIFFVDVPKEPSLKLIVQALCKDIGSQENHFQDDKLVVNRLKRWMNEIGQNPILLVLDDVWPKWESLINKHFAFQKPHYKVLVTSRCELFPRFGPQYHLQKLKEKEATTLLRHYAFSEDQENSRIPEDLVNQVVKHCKGYPLALKVIGTSLCGKPQQIWQRKLKNLSNSSSILIEDELLRCLKSSLDEMDEETDDEKGLLKECFLDLGSFPKGQQIPATALIDMWTELYELEEDHANVYLFYISYRNMANLVISRKDANESDGYYSEHFVTQHDMLKELAIHQNREGPVEQRKRLILESQNELKDLNEQPINAKLLSISTDGLFPVNWSNKQLPAEVFVLNFQTVNYTLPVFVGGMNKLKVLMIMNYGFFPVEVDNFQLLGSLSGLRRMRLERIAISSLTKIPAQLKTLKKISLYMCKFDQAFSNIAFKISDIFPNLEEINIDYCDDLAELPPGLCEIVSLKTLSITHCHKLSKLPEEIKKLVNLELLRLRSCIDMKELPDSICKLDKLTFLDISDCFSIRKLPEDIGKLCSLRTLNTRSCSRLPELPPSVVDLEHLEEVICDEELKEQWELCLPSSINIKLRLVKDDINLNWL